MARGAALEALNNSQRIRLAALSRILARGIDDDGDDLLQEAQVRWLKSDEPYSTPEVLQKYLAKAMYSIRYNRSRKLRSEKRQLGMRLAPVTPDAEEPVECVEDRSQETEDSVFAQQVYDRCEDEEIQTLIVQRMGNYSREQILEENGWDVRKYEAVQKRLSRMAAKLMLKGVLS